MAKTLAIGKVEKAKGPGMRMVMGTILLIDNLGANSGSGSFSVTDSAGSKIMRNIQSVFITPMNGSMHFQAQGSSSGYVTFFGQIDGTPLPTGGTCSVVGQFLAFGGVSGSI